MLEFLTESNDVFANVDPDINTNLINNLQNNAYYSLQELNTLFSEPVNLNHKTNLSFSLMLLNMQNQNSKHDKFVSFLNSTGLENSFSAIAITESWLTGDLCREYDISNYQYIGGPGRINRKGGGVGFYINDKYTFNIRSDLSLKVDDTVAESLAMSWRKQKTISSNIPTSFR